MEVQQDHGRHVQGNFGELIGCAEAIAGYPLQARTINTGPLSRVTRVVTSNARAPLARKQV